MDYTDPPPFTVSAQGQALTFYPGGRDRLHALLELIASARESIRMCFYIFAEDASGVMVRDALAAAARRGVAVKLILDGFGADARKAFFAPMCDAGGTFCCFSPRWTQRYLIRNHQKIVIVDGKVGMIGGFNVEDSYFAPPAINGWNDLGVTIEGSAVAELARWYDKLDEWTADPHANWRAIRRMVREWQPGDGPVRVLIGGPTRGLSSWARCVRSDLTGATRLDMIMAYFSPSNRLAAGDRQCRLPRRCAAGAGGQERQRGDHRGHPLALRLPAQAAREDLGIRRLQAPHQGHRDR